MEMTPSRRTVKAPAAWFTGDVWFDALAARPGQSVWCAPAETHWHGAPPDGFLEHLAMWEATVTPDGGTAWAGPVSDAEHEAGGR